PPRREEILEAQTDPQLVLSVALGAGPLPEERPRPSLGCRPALGETAGTRRSAAFRDRHAGAAPRSLEERRPRIRRADACGRRLGGAAPDAGSPPARPARAGIRG